MLGLQAIDPDVTCSAEFMDNPFKETAEPVLGGEEKPIAPPGELGEGAVRCDECGYRNMPAWGRCYACGSPLETNKAEIVGEPIRLITSFEKKNPFGGGTVVAEHATDGSKALRIDESYVSMDAAQDWSGYDYVKADVHTDAQNPLQLYFEVRDTATRDYWTRVNYTTIVPPGSSTLIIPTALYVGEKSRPGRPLIQSSITRMVFSIGEDPEAPLFVDNVRLVRDTETAGMLFDGLWALDVGPGSAPVMEGFSGTSRRQPAKTTINIGHGKVRRGTRWSTKCGPSTGRPSRHGPMAGSRSTTTATTARPSRSRNSRWTANLQSSD